jgi:hypothetical protein
MLDGTLRVRPLLLVAALAALGGAASVGCITETDDNVDTDTIAQQSCSYASSVYTPFVSSTSPSGSVAQYPWRGTSSTYPSGDEDFRAYSSGSEVECGSDKDHRSHLDVTAGCLYAVDVGGYDRGQIETTDAGAFRTVALGHASGDSDPVKWTDQSVEYRFYYSSQQKAGVNPGFKAFLRYRTEEDLYVASWRTDGVVQIQKKQCGDYTALAVDSNYGAPSRNTWHRIRFDAVGDELILYLDGDRVLTATSGTFSWGTAGIRIDAMDGAYLDDWHVQAP